MITEKMLDSIETHLTAANNHLFPSGQSRCFPFWQEVLACYVVNTNSEDISGAGKCVPVLMDYYECLHHKREVRTLYHAPEASKFARFSIEPY